MLAIITTDEACVRELLQKSNKQKEKNLFGTKIYRCNYKDHEFLIVITGYGKVNIGIGLSYLLQNYSVKVLLCVGTAGSLTDSNEIFSVVIPYDVLSYDVDFSPLGYEPAQIPELDKNSFQANKDLCDCAKRACQLCLTNYSNDLLASGDMFVADSGLANSIRRELDAGAVDCEAGTIGQFAFQNNIPFVCVKVICNFANNNAVRQYRLYSDKACFDMQRIVNKFLKEYYE